MIVNFSAGRNCNFLSRYVELAMIVNFSEELAISATFSVELAMIVELVIIFISKASNKN
jgi:hypothetical protein